MIKSVRLKKLFAAGSRKLAVIAGLYLFAALASAQEPVILKTESGSIVFSESNPCRSCGGDWVDSRFCYTEDCSLFNVFPGRYGNTATLGAGKIDVSGSHERGINSFRGSSRATYVVKVFSQVLANAQLGIKVRGNLSLNWQNFINDSAYTRFSFSDPSGKGTSAEFNTFTSLVPVNEVKTIEANTYSTEESPGAGYRYVGRVETFGSVELLEPGNPGEKANFSASVLGVEVFYRGKLLKINDAASNNQTWLVNGKLPKALSVKVVDGETGAPADAQITFTITGAANGAKFANEQTSISVPTESGIAAVSMWLGDTVGNYNVQVTCPADVCTSGVKEVLFTEKAVTTQDATKLTEMFCDGAHFYGQKLSNPLRVKALNLYTNEGVKDLAVTFKAKAGSPEGIIHTENTTTGLNGLASTYFTLGSALGTYTVIANCAQCLAGPTVECLVRGMYPPNAKHDSPEVGLNKRKRGVSITASPEEVYPQETGGSPAESIVAIAGASPNTSFTAQVVAGANTGGHQHHDAGRPKGTLVGWDGTICTGPSPITCTTSQNGSARLKYTSSEVGGWDTILIKMATGEEGDAIIKVRVPDLSSYPRNAMNHTYASNTEKEHPNFTYGTQELIDIIDTVASQYMTSMNNKAIISVNDMSLINGGVMDICSNWNSTAGCPRGSGHQSHRKGRSVDINSKPINPITRKTVTDSNFVAKLTELFRNQGCGKCVEEPIHFECPKTENCQ